MSSELSHFQRDFLNDVKEYSDADTHTSAYYFPFQSPRMSHVFILDVVDSLLVGGKIRGAEVLLSRLDLMTFIPYGYKFDEKIDQINHWFLVVKTVKKYISFEKFRNGVYVQMSTDKKMVRNYLMGEERRAVRVRTAVDAEDLELPEDIDVKVDDLLDTVATGITENWAIWNNCIHFIRNLISKMK